MNWYKKSIQEYIPLTQIDEDKVIDDVMKNVDWSSGTSDYHYEIAKQELGEDAEQESLEKRSKEILREELIDKYYERLWEMKRWVDEFPIWRAIQVIEGETIQETIDRIILNPVGVYWTYDQRAAACHWGNYGPRTIQVNLKSKIKPEVVDWFSTIVLQLDPSIGEEEKEIRLIKGSRIVITEVTVCSDEPSRDGESVEVMLEAIA